MQLPIYIDEQEAGTLVIERRGQWTVLDARLRDPGRVVRLSVFGERAAYLGVPAPSGGELRLTRRLSPGDMRGFPRRPEYAAERRREEKGERKETKTERRRVLWLGGKPHYF